MTPEKERLLHLKRIADALEAMVPLLEKVANPPVVINIPPSEPAPAPTYPWPNGGYRCARCGTWVMSGSVHACSGSPWGGTTGSPNICRTGSDQSSAGGPHYTVWNGGFALTIPMSVGS